MSSNNPPKGPTQRQKRLRVVKTLAKVNLADGEALAITKLRMQLLANGYAPCPNRDKRTLFKDWNALDPNPKVLAEWLHPRASHAIHTATGLLVVGELLTIDVDVPDPDIARDIRAALQKIVPHLFEAHGALERGRDDSSPKFMLFARRIKYSEPFTIKSQKWSSDPANEDVPAYQIEIFASDRNKELKASRQVGAFGPHTIDDDTGQVKIRYTWRGPSPAEVSLENLPLVTEEMALDIRTEADRIFAVHGLKPLKGFRGGRVEPTNVYDLTDETRFDGVDFDQVDLKELIEIYWQNEALGAGTRCSGSFTGEGGTRKDRCQVGWSGPKESGHITVHDHATETTHRPKGELPVPGDGFSRNVAELIELFKDLPPDGDQAPDDEASASFGDKLTAAIGEAAADALTESAIAVALAKLYGDRLCYAPAEKRWLRFDAPRWLEETTARIETKIVGTFCRGIPLPRTPAGARIRGKLESTRHLLAIERQLRGMLEYKDGFDQDPYLAAGPLLAVSLRTGKARLGRPKDRLRQSWLVDPAPIEDCPRWLRFIEEVMSGDRERMLLLQQWAGLSLCGDPTHQKLMFLYGEGRNGKNTYGDTLIEITGSYGMVTKFETLMSKRYEGHSTDIWALKGKRMVIASEVPEHKSLNTVLIKGLTGDAMLQARGIAQNNENFKRTWTITLLGNKKPKLESVDAATRARIRIVPFDRNFEAEGLMDPKLGATLSREAPGILRWALNGLVDALKNGLIEPARVIQVSNAYFDKHDVRNQFVAAHIKKEAGAETLLSEIYGLWKAFAEANDADPFNPRSLSIWLARLTGAGSSRATTEENKNVATMIGIRLKLFDEADEQDEGDET